MDMPWCFVFFLVSAFVFAGTFFDGGILCIPISLLITLVGFIVMYFEQRSDQWDKQLRKAYTPKKFIIENFTWEGCLYMVGIFTAMVIVFSGVMGCVGGCAEKPNYPYHNAITGKGQYEYGGSREQQRDLERTDERLKNDPNFR